MSGDPIEFPKQRAGRPCPICGRPAVVEAKPFCSKRCADVDLSRWLGGVYRVPTDAGPEDAGRSTDDQDEK